jgi:hypothetical protein
MLREASQHASFLHLAKLYLKIMSLLIFGLLGVQNLYARDHPD